MCIFKIILLFFFHIFNNNCEDEIVGAEPSGRNCRSAIVSAQLSSRNWLCAQLSCAQLSGRNCLGSIVWRANVGVPTRFTVEISSSPSCTCTDFKNNGAASNCVHVLFVLVFALKCTDKKVLVRRQMSKEEMENLMDAPLEIPDIIAAKVKAKSKSEMLG